MANLLAVAVYSARTTVEGEWRMLDLPRDVPTEGDVDPVETREWLDALLSVIKYEGPERARFLLERLNEQAGAGGDSLPYSANTPYLHPIPPEQEERNPGIPSLE